MSRLGFRVCIGHLPIQSEVTMANLMKGSL